MTGIVAPAAGICRVSVKITRCGEEPHVARAPVIAERLCVQMMLDAPAPMFRNLLSQCALLYFPIP